MVFKMVVDEYKRKHQEGTTRFKSVELTIPEARELPSRKPCLRQGGDEGYGPSSLSSSAIDKYKFLGITIRLNEKDYTKLRQDGFVANLKSIH